MLIFSVVKTSETPAARSPSLGPEEAHQLAGKLLTTSLDNGQTSILVDRDILQAVLNGYSDLKTTVERLSPDAAKLKR